MIPGFHAAVDAGISDAQDDRQHFDLAFWAKRLGRLLEALNAGERARPGRCGWRPRQPLWGWPRQGTIW